jgi:hypothetical protein
VADVPYDVAVRWLLAIALAACSGRSALPPPVTPPASPEPTHGRTDPVPLSDPSEYDIRAISRDAGKAIFARTGVGDPYRTGVPYPIFLAL